MIKITASYFVSHISVCMILILYFNSYILIQLKQDVLSSFQVSNVNEMLQNLVID